MNVDDYDSFVLPDRYYRRKICLTSCPPTFYVLHPFLRVLETVYVLHSHLYVVAVAVVEPVVVVFVVHVSVFGVAEPVAFVAVVSEVDVVAASEVVFVVFVSVVFEIADVAAPQVSVDIVLASVVLIPVSAVAVLVNNPEHPKFSSFPNIG